MALQTPTTLNGAIAAGATQILLTSGTGAAVGSFVQIDGEVFLIQDISQSPLLSVEPGQRGTAAVAHNTLAKAVIGLAADFPSTVPPRTYSYAVNGALTIAPGTHFLNAVATTGVTFTLAAPTAAQVGTIMRIVLTAAVASTVTNTTPGFNNGSTASDVASFAGAVGDTLELVAGIASSTPTWIVMALKGVTLG